MILVFKSEKLYSAKLEKANFLRANVVKSPYQPCPQSFRLLKVFFSFDHSSKSVSVSTIFSLETVKEVGKKVNIYFFDSIVSEKIAFSKY